MALFKKLIGLALLIGCISVVVHGRETMPAAPPNGSNVRFKDDAALATKAAVSVIMQMERWQVEDYYLFKVATPNGSPEAWAITTIFSEGKWHR